ncbi:iron-sulfur cluster assembly scaffold protein [bacterium]|nr:iron-sulfur cluster assembly scaffold protein [bacterium]
MYSQTVKDHFANPRNVGELENPDRIGTAKNQADGDRVQLHLSVRDRVIVDIRMKVMGCVAAIAATSCYSELIKGQTVENALAISKETLVQALGGLPENKIRCSLTCIDALKNAFPE